MLLYLIHVGVFVISNTITLSSLLFISHGHFFKKYYSYNEFYKLQVVDIFNISISIALLLMIIAQLLLPINFIWSVLSESQIKQID